MTSQHPDEPDERLRPDPVLQRAAASLRSADEESARRIDISAAVLDRVQSLTSGGRELVVHADDGSALHDATGSRVWVAERVLRTDLRVLLTTSETAPDRVRISVDDLDDGRQRVGVRIGLVGRYGSHLPQVGDQVRDAVVDLLATRLGPAPEGRRVDVEFTDVAPDDPRVD